jgi:hypothetical protein
MNGISTVDVLGLLVGLGFVDRPQRQLNATQVRHLQQRRRARLAHKRLGRSGTADHLYLSINLVGYSRYSRSTGTRRWEGRGGRR